MDLMKSKNTIFQSVFHFDNLCFYTHQKIKYVALR